MSDRLDEELSRALPPREPPAGMGASLRARIAGDLRPVRPLASPDARALAVLLPGLALALAVAYGRGLLDPLPAARAALFGVTVVLAGVGGWMALRLAVPAAGPPRAVVAAFLLLSLALGALALAAAAPSVAPLGPVGCLWMGLAVAVGPSLLAFWLIFRGFPIAPVPAGALGALAAGLFGLSMLHLTCPLTSVAHLVTMHGGVLVVTLVVGAVVGRLRQR